MVWTGWLALVQVAASPVYFPPAYERLSMPCPSLGRALPRFDELRRDWYSKHLIAAGEPSLFASARAGRGDTLRFIWLRSFDAPVIVRIEGLRGASPHLFAYELDGKGGYDPGRIRRRIERTLQPSEAGDLRRRLVAQNPLTLPPGSDGCESGTDGAQWIIERAIGPRYKMVDRWSPDAGPVRATGMAMLRLTGWKFDAIY